MTKNNNDILSDDELAQSVGGNTGNGKGVGEMSKEEVLEILGTPTNFNGIEKPIIYEKWLQANPNNVDKIIKKILE